MDDIELTNDHNLGDDVSPLVHEGIVDAPLEKVWNAWSTSAGLRQWMAPHADIDLRVGGLMRVNYDPDSQLGDSQTIINTVLSFEPERMISIKVINAPDGFPFPKAISQMWSVIYFTEVDANRTAVREVSLGFTGDEESQRMREFFDRGNAATLSLLQRHLAGATKQ